MGIAGFSWLLYNGGMKTKLILASAIAVLSMFARCEEFATDCYWHWMNGNITKSGITADLEYLKAGGIDAAMIFDVGIGVKSGAMSTTERLPAQNRRLSAHYRR